MTDYNGMKSDEAIAVLTHCKQATEALSRVVDIVGASIDATESRNLRRKLFDIFHSINVEIIEPIHRLYPQAAPTDELQ